MSDSRFHIEVVSVMSDCFSTPWTVARQAPLSMGFSRQEYWSGLPRPSPGDLPDLGMTLESPALQADSLLLNHQGRPMEVLSHDIYLCLSHFSCYDKLHVAADGIVLELSNIPVYVGMCVFRYTHTYTHTHIHGLAWWLSDKRTLLPMQETWV